MSTHNQNTPALIAYQAISSGEKTYWRRIGAAWTNKKEGFQGKRQKTGLLASGPDVTKPHQHPCQWGFTEIRTG